VTASETDMCLILRNLMPINCIGQVMVAPQLCVDLVAIVLDGIAALP